MTQEAATVTARLQAATADLLWMSEIDAPLAVIHWPPLDGGLTPGRLLELTNHPLTTLVQEVEVDQFFAGAVEDQDWFGEEERAIAQRYRNLVAILKESLGDLRVYRVGEITIDCYVVGQIELGDWLGLATQVTET